MNLPQKINHTMIYQTTLKANTAHIKHDYRCVFSLIIVFLLITKAVQAKEPPFQIPPEAEILKIKSAQVQTNKGTLYFELLPEIAPIHVANFKFLADQGFYRSAHWKSYFTNYIIQAIPNRKLDYSIAPEFSNRKHIRGTLGMARWEDAINPERRSSPSQFHILLRDAQNMNNNYTIFGILVKGWEVLDKLKSEDLILDVVVYIRPTPNTLQNNP